MSLNIGVGATQAIEALRGNANWDQLRRVFGELAQDRIDKAIDAPAAERIEATTYARALRDVALAFEAAAAGLRVNQTRLPKGRMTKDATDV